MKNEEKESLDFTEILKTLEKHYKIIIISGLIGFIASIILSIFIVLPKYSSSVDILVNQNKSNSQDEYTTQQADLQAVNTYKDILKKDLILSPVLKEMKRRDNYNGNISNLSKSIDVKNETNSQVITVTVKDKNPYITADIANSVANVFTKKIKTIMDVDNVSVVSSASVNKTPVSPNKKLYIVFGILFGLIIGVFIALIKESMDTTIQDEETIQKELGLNVLGSVYHIKKKKDRESSIIVIRDNEDGTFSKRRV